MEPCRRETSRRSSPCDSLRTHSTYVFRLLQDFYQPEQGVVRQRKIRQQGHSEKKAYRRFREPVVWAKPWSCRTLQTSPSAGIASSFCYWAIAQQFRTLNRQSGEPQEDGTRFETV